MNLIEQIKRRIAINAKRSVGPTLLIPHKPKKFIKKKKYNRKKIKKEW